MRAIQVCAGASAVYWSLYLAFAPAAAPDVALGWAEIGYLLLSIGLSIAAGYLTKDKKSPIQDERPTALATRGSYMAWLSGLRRLGYVMVWAGFRHHRQQQSEGGKGDVHDFFNPKQKHWYECAVHVLCVGPAHGLRKIDADGETIVSKPIDSVSHPSGTLVQEGVYRFYIFWGEHDQPKIPTSISSGGQTINIPEARGVDSRWPLMCYVLWIDFPLGTSPRWPQLSYEVYKQPGGGYLSNSSVFPEVEVSLLPKNYWLWDADVGAGTITFIAPPYDPGQPLAPPPPDTATARGHEDEEIIDFLENTTKVRLTGNSGLADMDLNVLTYSYFYAADQNKRRAYRSTFTLTVAEDLTGIVTPVSVLGFDPNTDDDPGVWPPPGWAGPHPAPLPTLSDQGYISIYDQGVLDGVNPAHSIADMLFEPWPSGAGLDPDEWDIASLEELGEQSETEGLRTTWVAQDAATVAARLGAGLQDLSCMIPVDPETGKIKFLPLREPVGTLRHLPNKLIVDSLPELEKHVGEAPVDFMIFGFPDRANNYRDMTIGRMEDGQIDRLEVARARSIAITISTNYPTSLAIANRREQEELVQNTVWTVETARATRKLLPGEAITSDFTTEVLRVLEVAPQPDSGKVQLKITVDAFGVAASEFVDEPPPLPQPSPPVEDDIANYVVEIPEYFDGIPPMAVGVLRLRASSGSTGAVLHASTDGTSYSVLASSSAYHAGGPLYTALPADGFFEPEDGTVVISTLSQDINEAQDLTGQDELWRLGHQLCILVSDAGVEICFLKKVTVINSTFRTLDGLIRARYGTKRLEHIADETWAFILPQTEFAAVFDPILIPQATRFFKIQPFGNGSAPLSEIAAEELTLYGHGVRPPPVSAVRVTAPFQANAYDSGDDVTLAWDYATPRTPGTSAGLMPAGQAVGTTDPEGPFLLEILTLADVVVRTENVTDNGYTYTNANIVADLGSEVSFKVRITQLRDGYASSTQTITVESI